MTDIDRDELVKMVIKRHFLSWAYTEPSEGLLFFGKQFQQKIEHLSQCLADTRDGLSDLFLELTEDELKGVAEVHALSTSEEKTQAVKALCRNARSQLPTFSRFETFVFGCDPESLADYTYWGDRDRFSFDEFVWLSVGLEPNSKLNDYLRDTPFKKHEQNLLVRKEVLRRQALFKSARKFAFSKFSISAGDAYEWFHDVSLEIPNAFREALEKGWQRANGKAQTPVELEKQTGKLDARKERSMQKLIIGMAVKGYSYDPQKSRNDVVAEIRSDLDHLGISLDDKTIRDHLKEAAKLLPAEALRE